VVVVDGRGKSGANGATTQHYPLSFCDISHASGSLAIFAPARGRNGVIGSAVSGVACGDMSRLPIIVGVVDAGE